MRCLSSNAYVAGQQARGAPEQTPVEVIRGTNRQIPLPELGYGETPTTNTLRSSPSGIGDLVKATC